jgi:L-asparaginase
VDIAYSYAGSDGTDIDAFAAAGARGIIVAGFAPGLNTPQQLEKVLAAQQRGVVIVQGSRVGSGRVLPLRTAHVPGALTADNLTPQKARILLMLALTVSAEPKDIQRLFSEY